MSEWRKDPGVDTAALAEQAAKAADNLAEAKRAALAGNWTLARQLAGDAREAAREAEADELARLIADAADMAELAALAPADDGPRIAAVTLDTTTAPPRREWLAGSEARGWLPRGRLAMLTGEGGAGKSRLALHLAVAVAGDAGREARRVLPSTRRAKDAEDDTGPVVNLHTPGAVAVIGWEDEAAEAARRLQWLECGGLAGAGSTAGRLHYLDAAAGGFGALWKAPDRFAPGDWTDFGRAALEWLAGIDNLALVVIDPLAAAYGDNENDRAAVRGFLSALNAWAAETGPAVLIVGHPPKNAANYSGSTDWRNGVRALWTLTTEAVGGYEKPENGAAEARGRCLTLDKASYGRDGARAWLKLHAAADLVGRTTALCWRECTATEAVEDRARWAGLTPPRRT